MEDAHAVTAIAPQVEPRPIGRLARVLLFLTALIPVLALFSGATVLLIYSLFVFILLFLRRPLSRAAVAFPLSLAVKFVALTIICGWIAELGAWYENYGRRAPNPALLHPQLIPDLLLAIGLYGGGALAWLLVLRRWRFGLAEVFVTIRLLGIFVEQSGVVIVAIAQSLFVNPLAGLLLAAFVFVVYGPVIAIPYMLLEPQFAGRATRSGWLKFPAVALPMVVFAVTLTAVVGLIASAVGLIPPKQPIWTHPFF
jgi:hypothetical protein